MRATQLRGAVRDKIQKIFAELYGFEEGSSGSVKAQNIKRYEFLKKKSAFTCKV
jgi:hypothetical protein